MEEVESEGDLAENAFFSSEHAWVESYPIQRAISAFERPGFIYLPSGTWEESIIITQHNLTLIGEGEDTVLKSDGERPPVTILAPVVRLVNITVQSEHEGPAISLSHGDATQVTLQNVKIAKSEGHGIYRDENYGFALGAILNCEFRNIGRHAIYAPTGTGPRNVVVGNSGQDIDGDFIHWGVDESLLANNECEDSSINLTQNAHKNMVLTNGEIEVVSGWPEDNIVL